MMTSPKPSATPVLPNDSPPWVNILLDSNKSLERKLDDTVRRMEQSISENGSRISVMERSVSTIESTCQDQAKQISTLTRRVSDLESKVTALEDYSRRENLLFHKIPETGRDESGNTCLQLVRRAMLDAGIENSPSLLISTCHRLGRYNATSKSPRSIIVRFISRADRDLVYSMRSKFRSSTRISPDFSPLTLSRRRPMIQIFARAKELEAFKSKTKLIGDRLYIGSKAYTVDNINELPPQLSPDVLFTRSSNDTTVFYSKFSPFSNFHPSVFIANDVRYNCMEQYLQHCKAVTCGYHDIAAKILTMDDPVAMKSTSKGILDTHAWNSVAEDTVKAGLLAKFTQNPSLSQSLAMTGKSVLGESSKFDSHWGTGRHLDDPQALDPSAWSGRNRLGNLLMEVRELIRSSAD